MALHNLIAVQPPSLHKNGSRGLLETKIREETATGLVILAAGNEWEQRLRAEISHSSS